MMAWWKSLTLAFVSDSDRVKPLVDPQIQTKELPDGSRICSSLDEVKSHRYEDATTLYEVIRRGSRVSNNGPMLGQRIKQTDGSSPYIWIRYEEIIRRSLSVGRAFRKLDLEAGQETFIGVFARNRPEWIIVEHAAFAFNNVLVPFYDTLGLDASIFIINQTSIQVIVCDTIRKVTDLLDNRSKCPSLKCIVLIDAQIPGDIKEVAMKEGILLYTFCEFEDLGRNVNINEDPKFVEQPPKPDDLCTICYTSGTTGTPKGVMLTHGNVIAGCTTLEFFKNANIDHQDVLVSFLPLAHMFERVVQAALYMEGGSVGFFAGDLKLLADDIKQLRPTLMPVVPRVLSRVYDKVMAEVDKSRISKMLLNTALALKSNELSNWIVRNTSLVDKLVFKKIQEGFGGRVKVMMTGSAPISDELLTFIRCALGCFVVEGYGLTECVAACTVTIEGDFVPGHVGVPSPCNSVKLVDVPELNYFAKDQAGEVCIKGFNVFRGYYKMPEETKEALDSDGWFHTGDIGRWTERGTLKLIDRKKHIFKLSQGEYIAPEKIENVYLRSKYVAQCFVYGESLKSCLVSIVIPDFEVLKQSSLPDGCTLKELSNKEICESMPIKKMIMEDILSVGKNSGLKGFEQAKDIFLWPEMFSIENDLLTPTLKNKRPNLKIHFQGQIEEMYKLLP